MKYPLLLLTLFFALAGPLFAQPAKRYTAAEHQELLSELEKSKQELLRVLKPLSEKQYFHRLDDKTWSANDIVEHLGLVEEGYVRELWFSLATPRFPDTYLDSTRGGDETARAYATSPTKSEARGTNLPRQRFCDAATGIRVFKETNDLVVDFFTKNQGVDLRRVYLFRNAAKGSRWVRDDFQFGLWLIAHRVRHTNQLKRMLADSRFPQ